MRTRLLPLIMAFLCVPLFTFAPQADARLGLGSSMGSRGSRTYSAPPPTSLTPNRSSPITRSTTSPPNANSGRFGGVFGSNTANPSSIPRRPPFAARHPFLTGFAGGLLGAGLVGMLSGHGFFGGFSGGGSFFGFLLQAFVIAGIIILVIRLWRKPKMSSNGGSFNQSTPISLSPQDYTEFQRILLNLQSSWSAQDIPTIRQFATPEMANYFNEQLSHLTSRGARNIVSNVQFIRGDLAEAWREGSLTYATVAMRYSMIDVTTDSMGNVIDGSQTEPQTVTELWTFLRADGRGNWVLSAIQQGA